MRLILAHLVSSCSVLLVLGSASADTPPPPEQHVSKATKPPAPGAPLAELPAYGTRLGVAPKSDADREFDRIVDEFLRAYFRSQPVRATNTGIHEFDALLPATSQADIQASITELHGYLARLQKLDSTRLGRARHFDQAMLTTRIQGMLLDLETIQTWKRDPNFYLSIASQGVNSLLKRDFAPLDDRVWNLVARIMEIPRVLADARANLDHPPKVYTEIAVDQSAGLVNFLGNLVPAQVAGIRDPVLRQEFDHHLAQAMSAANAFHEWLKSDLLPRSNGDFRLGADVYAKKLLYDEMVSTPLDSLYHRGEVALHDTQEQMKREAEAIQPGLSVTDALAKMAADAPSAKNLVPTTQAKLDGIRRFVAEHGIITPPPKEDLRAAETPVFQRSLSFASMDSPGVLETKATEAYYYVTPPDTTWPLARQVEHLGFYNSHQLEIVSIHEALPGHYYQFLALKKCPSLIRALFGPGSNSEGWAHYCEQMMVEEGYGAGDHQYRLAQLNLALQRICRYMAGIALHTRGMTYEEAVSLFQKQGYMAPVNAEREARRGTSDPTYLVYTLGKWEILDLRNEVKQREGKQFNLKSFNDRFLMYGRAPVPLIREDWLAAMNRQEASSAQETKLPPNLKGDNR
ncbi:MAG TPA: DUF885 domain-containing protein [Candidatus Eisenbacteria bacterium]|nr:DUF885 domain-containing protein [Candidatus Eisenbacteria bacterium]